MRSGAGLVEPFRGVQRPRDMWRSVLLGVVLAGVLAGCSLGGASGGGGAVPAVVACAATLGRPAKALGAPVGGFAVGRGPVYAVFDVIPRYVPTTTGRCCPLWKCERSRLRLCEGAVAGAAW